MRKRLFSHGGSKAVDLPISFVRKLPSNSVRLEEKNGYLFITPDEDIFTSMESEPFFAQFIEALLLDAMSNSKKLKDIENVWDSDWDELLEGVIDDEE